MGGWGGSSHTNVHVCAPQTVMEKHKMNVPETMNEVLDMSDDEGQAPFYSFWVRSGGGGGRGSSRVGFLSRVRGSGATNFIPLPQFGSLIL